MAINKTSIALAIGSTTLAVLTLSAITNIIYAKPSPILTLADKRYILPPEAKRSVYKTEAECKNAVSADFWLECEAANLYYTQKSELGDKWLGPVYSGNVDPNLSLTAQNLPVSTVLATNHNVGKGPLGKLVAETRSSSSNYKPLTATSTQPTASIAKSTSPNNALNKSTMASRLKSQTKIQPIRRVVF